MHIPPAVTLYVVGKIIGCFGLKGFVKLRPTTHTPQRLKNLRQVFVGNSSDEAEQYSVDGVEIRPNGTFLKFSAVNDRSAAEMLIGQLVFVDEHEVQPPPKGSFFTHEMIGCEVWTVEGKYVGTVREIYKLPAQDVWEVVNGSAVSLIPAVKEFVRSVDLQRRRIEIHLIEGLIEGQEPSG